MLFKELRKSLSMTEDKTLFVEWTKSGIVEAAELMPNGAIRISNVISRKQYILPRQYKELNLRVLDGGLISIGKLVPKTLQ